MLLNTTPYPKENTGLPLKLPLSFTSSGSRFNVSTTLNM